jgi:hypothetical protein
VAESELFDILARKSKRHGERKRLEQKFPSVKKKRKIPFHLSITYLSMYTIQIPLHRTSQNHP